MDEPLPHIDHLVTDHLDPEPTWITGQYMFELTLDEVRIVNEWASNFIGEKPTYHTVVLQLTPGRTRRWTIGEFNLTGWLVTVAEASSLLESDLAGCITLPVAAFGAVIDVFEGETNLSWFVDTESSQIQVCGAGMQFVTKLPDQQVFPQLYQAEQGDTVVVEASDLVKMARVARSTVASLEERHMTSAPLPFLTLSFEEGGLIGSRDWRHFEGGITSLEVPARGDWKSPIQIQPRPIIDELNSLDRRAPGKVTLTVLHHFPRILCIRGRDWGYVVELESEQVHRYKREVLVLASQHGYDFDDEDLFEDNHVLNVFVGDAMVPIHVLTDELTGHDVLRAEIVVSEDVEMNEFIAQELNSWNTSLEGIKVLHLDRRIIVRHEVLAECAAELCQHLALLNETAEGVRMVREVFS